MRHDESIELPGGVTLTRRQMVKVFVGVAASSVLLRQAGAGEVNSMADIEMEAAIIFDPHMPNALRQAHPDRDGLTGQFTGKITEQEAHDVLHGKLPDGTEVPVFRFEQFKQGIANLPMHYGVVLDFELARKAKSGFEAFDVLKDDPNMIVRAGGVEAAAAYLDKARDRQNTKVMGNWHPHNRIDPDQPQTRILLLAGNSGKSDTEDNEDHHYGYDAKYGISGNASIIGLGRYVALAPRNESTGLQDLDFEL